MVFSLSLLAGLGVASSQNARVEDIGLESGFQDTFFGHHKKGRALVAADFDLDGRVDFYFGNPGDESFVARNVADTQGRVRLEVVQVLTTGDLAWGAAAADYDNDGDYDLYISVGANEGIGFDYLFKNLWIENQGSSLQFVDVTSTAGISGPVPPGRTEPIPIASANGVWGDYDLDGDVDLFVNGNIHAESLQFLKGRNILWRNNGNGTFTDVTGDVGLDVTRAKTRNSSFLDYDNDGDLDLFESNMLQANVLWRNRLVETGAASFEDVTLELSPPGEDLRFPFRAFGSAVADFNQDGWQDIFVFLRGRLEEAGSPYPVGHAIFLNLSGTGFKNVAEQSELNKSFAPAIGVMGCQIGDLNGDAVPDIFVGNGGPPAGESNELFISDSAPGMPPHYHNLSALIDFPAPEDGTLSYPPYPYRTHGTAVVDVDGDHRPEVAVVNGGPVLRPNTGEPNRLFRFSWSPEPRFLEIRPVGDGSTVSRDAIGTRIAVAVSRRGQTSRTLHSTLLGGSAFAAQNGFKVRFGLGQADAVESVQVSWPDGTQDTFSENIAVDSSIVVFHACSGSDCVCTVTETPEASFDDDVDNDCDGLIDEREPD